MSNVKNVILKKKIEGIIYDLLVKTDATNVLFGDSTVHAKLTKAIEDITALNTNKVDSTAVATAIANALVGVVVTPTYDSETRTITLPNKKADGTTENLTINLGKDMVVKSGALDAKKENIELTLSNDDVVKIPVASLVDIYTGVSTNSVNVTVSEDNKISAEVKVSTKEGNAVQVVTEEGKEGIYVPQAQVMDISGKVDKVEGKGLSTNDYTDEEKTKLAGLTNYDDTELTTKVNSKSRVIVSATEPTDLTENDMWFQDITNNE